jgi:hypothetical protein
MKDALGHGSNGRGGRVAKPIPNHPYHQKTDAELRYIVKDAKEAADAAQSMGKLETKYNDQVNDAATVLGYRARGGQSDAPADRLASGPKSEPVPIHDSMGDGRQYWGSYKSGNSYKTTGPHGSREEAASAAMSKLTGRAAMRGEVSTGYGTHGPSFDIRWHRK